MICTARQSLYLVAAKLFICYRLTLVLGFKIVLTGKQYNVFEIAVLLFMIFFYRDYKIKQLGT